MLYPRPPHLSILFCPLFMLFCRPFCLFSTALSLLSFCGASLNEHSHSHHINPPQKQIISMDPSNLDMFFFRSAIFALFKAKSDTILSSLPITERVVFRQCEFDSNGRLNKLAKCLVSLFNIRDFRANSNKNFNDSSSKFVEMPWISAISTKILQAEMEKKSEREIMEKMGKDKPNNLKKNMLKLEEILERRKGKKREKQQTDRRKKKSDNTNPRPKRAGKSRGDELTEYELEQYPHVRKLVRVERFYRLLDKCNEYIRRKDEEHSKFLQLNGMPFQLQTKSVEQSPLLGLVQRQLRQSANIDKLSFLSPKLLSIIPDRHNQQSLFTSFRHNWSNSNTLDVLSALLSPTLFSFHEQGDLSLPFLLKLGLPNGSETIAWLDLLLRISGASSTLDGLIALMAPEIDVVERHINPAIVRLEQMEQRFRNLRMSESKRQRKEMASYGYTLLSKEQSRVVLGEEAATDDALESEADMERVLEQDIRTIARMSDGESSDNKANEMDGHQNGKGETDGYGNGNAETAAKGRRKRFLRTEPFGQLRLLNPYFFANQIHDGAVLRRVALSPRAFSSSVLSPEFGQLEVLSPRAVFAIILSPRAAIANILSPSAFIFRLLSPQAFLAEVLNPKAFTARILSPRAMSAYVLSPRAFIATILSPKTLEFRILSPSTLSFTVLSPTIGSVKVASPQSFSMVILSPSILSPSFLNKGTGNIKILSPSILSGGGGGGEK